MKITFSNPKCTLVNTYNPQQFIVGETSCSPMTGQGQYVQDAYRDWHVPIFKGTNIEDINYIELKKLFIKNGSISSEEVGIYDNFLKNLSKLDIENIKEKYFILVENAKGKTDSTNNEQYKKKIKIENIGAILEYDKLDAKGLHELIILKKSRFCSNWIKDLDINELVKNIMDYDEFEDLPTSRQVRIINDQNYIVPTYNTLSTIELDKINEDFSIYNLAYIKDRLKYKDKDEFIDMLKQRIVNKPCKPIKTNRLKIIEVLSENNIEHIFNTIQNVDLKKYKEGFSLKYPREEFIKDFKKITNEMSTPERKKLYQIFRFNINQVNDIIRFPYSRNVQENDGYNEEFLDNCKKAQACINKFIYGNSIKLEPEDCELEKILNDIISIFPEFISAIGKKQHRIGTIDYHTFDDIQKIAQNPKFNELSSQEKRIMFVATLFHDFSKAEGQVDPKHPQKSAIVAKEIIKKIPISYDEKERIYNLINHSHWYTDNDSNRNLAFYFRRPNDFKMAEIFSQADSQSAGFKYNPAQSQLDEIQKNINFINTDGILLFADNIPYDSTNFDTNKYGVKYLDFRDPEASVERYGFSKGTKVKDLNFFCHCTKNTYKELASICDDSKNICLSTMLLDKDSNFDTQYSTSSYIVSGNNANIVLGSKYTSGSGSQRDLNYALEGMYKNKNEFKPLYFPRNRKAVPNLIRKMLDLNNFEYLEMYNKIANIDNINDIPDVELSTGKYIPAQKIKITIQSIQKFATSPIRKANRNEFVIYNPKIEAKVINSKLYDIENIKSSPIPIVLI